MIFKGPGLYQTAFLYQTIMSLDDSTGFDVAPHSIISKIFAVAVKLWWGALEEHLKRLQPYVMMAREPTKASGGVAL